MDEQTIPCTTQTCGGTPGQDDGSALVGIDAENGISDKPLENESEGAFLLVPTSCISVGRTLSRQHFSEDALERLAESIKKVGMLQPIVVGRNKVGGYYLMAGIRRWLAAKSLGIEKVPCILKYGEPILISLTENTVREDLSPVEQAEALSHAMRVKGLKQKEIAEEFGKSTTAINDILRLNGLPEEIKKKCRLTNDYSRSALLNIVRLKNEKRMLIAFKKIEKKASDKTGEEPSKESEPDGQKQKPMPRESKDVFIAKLNSAVSTAQKIGKGSINQYEMTQILACLQKMEMMMKQLGPKKSRVRDFFRWLKPARWF